jgi:transposase InsO family protein
LRQWIADVGTQTACIEPGSPWENAFCESFNSKLRDELLNDLPPEKWTGLSGSAFGLGWADVAQG